jgi:hypothetical protein
MKSASVRETNSGQEPQLVQERPVIFLLKDLESDFNPYILIINIWLILDNIT